MFVICETISNKCGIQSETNYVQLCGSDITNFTKSYLSNKSLESIQNSNRISDEVNGEEVEDTPSLGVSETNKPDSMELEENYSKLIESLDDANASVDDSIDSKTLLKRRTSCLKQNEQATVSTINVINYLLNQPNIDPEFSCRIIQYQVSAIDQFICTQLDYRIKFF